MFLLLITSPLNLNCLKFNSQSSLFLSLSLFNLSSPYLHHKAHFLFIYLSQLIIFLFSKNKKNKKKTHHLPPNKLLMFLLLLTSPLNLDCLKFNSQSSLFLTYHLLISTIKPTSYLYLSLNSSSSSSQKKKIFFLPNKLLMCLLLMTSPLNLNFLKFNDQSSFSLSFWLIIFLFYGLC